jgi:DNA-binding winged helix-turn-helix (wHTH) protein
MNTDLGSVAEPAEPAEATGANRIPQLPSRYIRFGPFEIDQRHQEVTKNGSRLKLQFKVYQILIALIEKQGQVVTRDELCLRLWPSETEGINFSANVNTSINKLRQALGDSCNDQLYVETVPRRGYRLRVEVEFADRPVTAAIMSAESGLREHSSGKDEAVAKFDFWITIGVVALIFAGMLLGAGIARFWITHFWQGSINSWP